MKKVTIEIDDETLLAYKALVKFENKKYGMVTTYKDEMAARITNTLDNTLCALEDDEYQMYLKELKKLKK